VSADQDLRARLAGLIKRETGMPFTSKLAADAVMTDSALLDDICEFRAHQLNAERSTPVGVADVERFTAVADFARTQMYREAAASVALDHDERAETISLGIPYPTNNLDNQEC
jgi:hypothetical protein